MTLSTPTEVANSDIDKIYKRYSQVSYSKSYDEKMVTTLSKLSYNH